MTNNVFGFTVISGNRKNDILTPQAGRDLNNIITTLEQVLVGIPGTTDASAYISELLTHKNNNQNPHHDNGANLEDFLSGILAQIYAAYIAYPTTGSNPLTLSEFTSSLLNPIIIANAGALTDPTQQNNAMSVALFFAMVASHNTESVDTHISFQESLTGQILPTPTLYIDEFFLYDQIVSPTAGTTLSNGQLASEYLPVTISSSIIPPVGTIILSFDIENTSQVIPLIHMCTSGVKTAHLTIKTLAGGSGISVYITDGTTVINQNISTVLTNSTIVITYGNGNMTVYTCANNVVTATSINPSLPLANYSLLEIGALLSSSIQGANTISLIEILPGNVNTVQLNTIFGITN